MKKEFKYTIRFNRSRKTYTIREYVNGELINKYRSYPQGESYSETWTQHDIINFLRNSDEYYIVKK